MKLNRSQKKFLKKNLRKLTLAEIAKKLDLPENQLKKYLKSIWPKQKYEKFIEIPKGEGEQYFRDGVTPRTHLGGKWLKKNWKVFIFLAILVFAVYFNSLDNEFVSDDIAAILKNENLGNLFFWIKNQTINSLRYFFFFLVYKIGGRNPLLFRLLNLLFHLGSVWVIYALISLLYTASLAFIVAALFAVHPILTEAVVWISGGVHAQYVFFVLLSFLFYLKSRFRHRGKKKYYFASLVSFLFALLTTEKAVVLPLIIFVFELSVGQLSKTWKKMIPFFLLSGACVLFVLLGGFLGQRITILKAQFFHEKGFYNPLEQIPVAIGSYLRLIFWPDKLTIYQSEMVFDFTQFLLMALVTMIFFGAIAYTFIDKKYRPYFFWLSFFVISLLPMLTPFKVAWIVAERYVYLGALGIFVVIAFVLQEIGKRLTDKRIGYGILGILLILLSLRTVIRNEDWKNHGTLWLAAARTSPSSAQNHNNLGDLYGRQGDPEKAVAEFKKAIELRPDYADAYHNLANTYQEIGRIKEAIDNYQRAIKYQPLLWQSYQNLAAIYYEQEQYELSLQVSEAAVKINPEEVNLYVNLVIVYSKLGNQEKAQEAMQKAIQLDPEHPRVKQLLNPNLEI